jgi:6-phosphofructokinase 2
MARIRTLTLNPTIDLSGDIDTLEPTHKLRTRNERIDPGGGGINVARALKALGMPAEAIFLAGGATGAVLDERMERAEIPRRLIPIAGDTRLSHTIHECSTGREYRFVPEGPCVDEIELAAAIEEATRPCDILVTSGSLPPCTPADVYARLARQLAGTAAKLVLDTSGEELSLALDAGGIFLAKPSRSELEHLAGRALRDRNDIAAFAGQLVHGGKAELVAVTLGSDGALLLGREFAISLPAVPVEARSAVGAGDSFLGGLIFGLASGQSPTQAFRIAVAAGAAATLAPGTALCLQADVDRLIGRVPQPSPVNFE